jgi:serine phosphatase RsbU (regulator of sigma subunit)
MTKKEFDARKQFAAIIDGETTNIAESLRLANLLCRHGKTYARLQEANCNGVGSYANEPIERFNKRQARFEKELEHKEQLIERRVKAICKELGEGFEPVFEGDPRGFSIKIKVPSGRTDGGHDGICVPTS